MAEKNRAELLDLIPAYALGALDDPERIEFEAWLHTDPEAQAILSDYRAVADHLVALAPLRPAPSHLQVDLRQRLAASRTVSAAETRVMSAPRLAARPTTARVRAWMLAAALFVVVIAGALFALAYREDDAPPKSAAERLWAELKDQPDTAAYDLVAGEVSAEVWGYLMVASDGQRAVLCLWELPALTDEQVFQVWMTDENGQRTSGGLFDADPAAKIVFVEVPFDEPVSAYQGVGVSLEPAGGSPYTDRPSGPRVLSVPLNAAAG